MYLNIKQILFSAASDQEVPMNLVKIVKNITMTQTKIIFQLLAKFCVIYSKIQEMQSQKLVVLKERNTGHKGLEFINKYIAYFSTYNQTIISILFTNLSKDCQEGRASDC